MAIRSPNTWLRSRACGYACAVALAAPAAASGSEIIDRVLAVVSGELILLSDVAAARALGLVDGPGSPDPDRAALSRLIDRSLMLAEVERYAPPEPDETVIEDALQAVRARFPSAEALEAVLARSGIDQRHLRERVRQDVRLRAYLDQRFTVAPPSEDELGRYYRDHAADFTRDGSLVPFEQARDAVAQAAAADRRQAIVDEWVAGLRRRADIVDLYAR
jgi:hypothetical protein